MSESLEDLPKELAYCHQDVWEKMDMEQKQWIATLAASFIFPKVALEKTGRPYAPKTFEYMTRRLKELKCEFATSSTKNRILWTNPRQVKGGAAMFCEVFHDMNFGIRPRYSDLPKHVYQRFIALGFCR
jgi:hypothetical protein